MNSIEKEALAYVVDQGATHYARLRNALNARYPGAIERARAKVIKQREANRYVGRVPAWAKRFVKKHGQGQVVSFTWRQSRTKRYSSGHCALYRGRIVVTAGAGSNEDEKKGVVLHEIAHAVTMAGHDDKSFWAAFHGMLVAEGLYRAYMRERPWRNGSLKAAARASRKAASR